MDSMQARTQQQGSNGRERNERLQPYSGSSNKPRT